MIDNISYYNDAKVGTELTAEADWKRRGYYLGPQVSLDVITCAPRCMLTGDGIVRHSRRFASG